MNHNLTSAQIAKLSETVYRKIGSHSQNDHKRPLV